MNTEFGSLTAVANPFAAFLSPQVVMAAHERLTSRVMGIVHRPLDKPMIPKAGQVMFAELDAELDGEDDEFAAFVELN